MRDQLACVVEQPQSIELEAGRELRIALRDFVVDLEEATLVGVRRRGEDHVVLVSRDFAGHLRAPQLLVERALPNRDAFLEDGALLRAERLPAPQPDGA